MTCQLLVDIADQRCHCVSIPWSPKQGSFHQCVQIELYWHTMTDEAWDSLISLVIVIWDCGETSFDLCKPEGAWQANLTYIALT